MFRIFLFILIFAPLAFGTVEPWSYAVMEILTFFALAMLLIKGEKSREALLSVPGIVPLLLFLGYILFQVTPLPPAFIHFLSPCAYRLHHTVAALSDPDAWMTLSIHPGSTLNQFFRWATYVAFYVLTIQLLARRDRLKKTVVIITVFGALLSFSSILQFYLTENMALWFRHVPRHSLIVGPYICHNHYAGLMAMLFPVVLALFFFHRPVVRNATLIKGIVEILSQEKANIHVLIGTAALLIATSVFVSLSRGGMLSVTLSLVVFTLLLFKRKISRRNALLVLGFIFVTTLSVGWFGWEQIFERFARLKNAEGIIYEARLDFWKDSVAIVKDYTVTGSGMGTFVDIYPAYQRILENFTVEHAHNDYLELAVEGGMIGVALAASFLIVLLIKSYRAFLERRNAFSVYLYIGSITGLTALLIHGTMDFNLQVGANGLWFFFLAGLAVSAANTSMKDGRQGSRLQPVRSPMISSVSVFAATFLAVGVLVYHICGLTGKFYFSHIRHYTVGAKTPEGDLRQIEKIAGYAAAFDPLNGAYPFARANALLFLKEASAAEADFKKALRLNPGNSLYLKRMGDVFAKKGMNESAEKLLFASVVTDISNAENTLEYGAWLLAGNAMEKGLAYIKKAIELDKRKIDSALTTMAIYDVSETEMQKAVPKIPGAVMAYADFLFGTGNIKEAERQYLAALAYMETQKKIERWQILRIYDFFKKRGSSRDALKVMIRASELMPEDAEIRIMLGDLYRDMEISYRAMEEYQQALFIDPDNQKAKGRLETLKRINP